jgi:hypothetical protein
MSNNVMNSYTKILDQDVKLEQAEFLNRLMIDSESLSQQDIKIGLCLLHDILINMKEKAEG